jgi:hypothetical protein
MKPPLSSKRAVSIVIRRDSQGGVFVGPNLSDVAISALKTYVILTGILLRHAFPVCTPLDKFAMRPHNGLMVAKALRQVARTGARASHPKQRVDEAPVVAARPALPGPAARHEVPRPLPLIVAQHIDIPNHQG